MGFQVLLVQDSHIGPDKDSFASKNAIIFLPMNFTCVQVLKRTVLLRRFFCVPTIYV